MVGQGGSSFVKNAGLRQEQPTQHVEAYEEEEEDSFF